MNKSSVTFKLRIALIFICFLSGIIYAQSSSKPNILFIAIDDLKPTIGSFGDKIAITPNIDALASEGVVFLNNHCQQAVCGPSRASLMTGRRPDFTKVRDLKTKMRDINPDIVTIPQYFKENGYTTLGTGKIYDPRCVDEYLDKPSWTVPFIREHSIPYPEKYGKPALGYYQNKEIKATIAKLGEEAKVKNIKNVNKFVSKKYKPPFEVSNVPDEAYTDGAIAVHALSLLETVSKQPNKPFFLAVGFKRPHLPFVAPKKYWDLYNRNDIGLAPFQKKSKNGVNIAYHNSGELRSYKSPEVEYKIGEDNLVKINEETQKELIHGYYACVSFVDTQIGKIMQSLKEKGLDKNTIIVVWGDHGWHLGDHSLWNKHSNFEQATRSPLLIYSPFEKKPIQVNSPTEFVDIFPTLCDMASLSIPNSLEGKSLLPIVEGEKKSVKKYAISQQPRGKTTGYTFRTEQYRYTIWVGKGKKSTDKFSESDVLGEELYDYKNDPLETVNQFNKPIYRAIQNELKKEAMIFFANKSKD